MADHSVEIAEQVSALVDGQLQGEEFVQTLADLESSSMVRAQWDVYHVLGDVLRSNQVNARAHDADFVQRLRQRLSEEQINFVAIDTMPVNATVKIQVKSESANNSSWRRVAGFAAIALMGVIAWQGLHLVNLSDPASAPQLARQNLSIPTQAVSAVAPTLVDARLARQALPAADGSPAVAMTLDAQVMIRDPQFDALLDAHRQFGGISALQVPAGFLRNASFAEAGR